jgi:hypothetical protein
MEVERKRKKWVGITVGMKQAGNTDCSGSKRAIKDLAVGFGSLYRPKTWDGQAHDERVGGYQQSHTTSRTVS